MVYDSFNWTNSSNCVFVLLYFSNSLAFATEPVVASLANFLGNFERMPVPVPINVKVTDTSYSENR